MSEETKETKKETQKEEVKKVEAVKEEIKQEVKAEEKPKVELSKKLGDMMKSIEEMSVMELADFVKALEERFGVSAAMPVVQGMGAAGAGGAQAQEAEEKTEFEVVLAKVGPNKIQVIKELRALTTLGLKEAKDLVDGAPKTIKAEVPKEEADKIKAKLEAVGASVEFK